MTTFLKSATDKNPRHPEYSVIHGNLSTDGYRAHRDNSLQPAEDTITKAIENAGAIPSQPRNRATVSRVDLVNVCKRALAFRTDWDRSHKHYPSLRMCMNGSLIAHAHSEELGDTYSEITDGAKVTDKYTSLKNGLKIDSHVMVFKHHNPDTVVEFALNPKFLLDALQGMEGETVEIDIPSPRATFYMTDGTREAAIMPVTIGK